MKILVCTDGSERSQKVFEKAAIIAKGCKAVEVTVIHVYDPSLDMVIPYTSGSTKSEHIEDFRKIMEERKDKRKKILSEALKFFESKNIKARTILKAGHPSNTIVSMAHKEQFDIIVLGSRGLGGLQKLLLGSVSNAVIQEVENCSVLIVK
jgi:nucleotide-binding universal stress UspA family protein